MFYLQTKTKETDENSKTSSIHVKQISGKVWSGDLITAWFYCQQLGTYL